MGLFTTPQGVPGRSYSESLRKAESRKSLELCGPRYSSGSFRQESIDRCSPTGQKT